MHAKDSPEFRGISRWRFLPESVTKPISTTSRRPVYESHYKETPDKIPEKVAKNRPSNVSPDRTRFFGRDHPRCPGSGSCRCRCVWAFKCSDGGGCRRAGTFSVETMQFAKIHQEFALFGQHILFRFWHFGKNLVYLRWIHHPKPFLSFSAFTGSYQKPLNFRYTNC